jgi:hypothetical protein
MVEVIENNLLTKLQKWAVHQEENFVTESFVHLLLHVIKYEPAIALKILDKVSGSKLCINSSQIQHVRVRTQPYTQQGRPDIEIRYHDFLLFVEVKINSDFGKNQLNQYKKELSKSGMASTVLTTITKYPFVSYKNAFLKKPNIDIRWHEISDLIYMEKCTDAVSQYLLDQFVGLLSERGIAMDKVSWELKEGMISFQNLIGLLGESLDSIKIPVRRVTSLDWWGYYTTDKKLFFGVYLDNPDIVTINSEEVKFKKNVNFKINPLVGRFNGDRWQNDLELSSEEIHFFSRSKASQIECLEKFVKESIDFVKKVII